MSNTMIAICLVIVGMGISSKNKYKKAASIFIAALVVWMMINK